MIDSKQSYQYFLEQDRLALGIKLDLRSRLRRLWLGNEIWSFQRSLRKVEYYRNCKRGVLNSLIYAFLRRKLERKAVLLGFSIPENVFGPGLAIVHRGTIVVSPHARIGRNCRIHVCTNIGASGGGIEAPKIGNYVYIAPGVKIYGDIKVADRVAFAANAAVNKDCLDSDSVYGGIPAKRIGEIEIGKLIPTRT